MNKIEITCVCDGIRLPDLGITLVKGETIQLTEGAVSSSSDLRHARRVGGVTMRTVKGPQVMKDPPKRKVRRDTSRMRVVEKRAVPEPVDSTPSAAEEFQKILSASLQEHQAKMSELTDALRQSLETAVAAQPEAAPQAIDMAMIESVIQAAVEKVAVTVTPSVVGGSDAFSSVGDKGPMFIPEGIVVDAEADIGTSEGSSGFSVDEATEALRAMKKAKKKK